MENTHPTSPVSTRVGYVIVGIIALAAIGILAYERLPQTNTSVEEVQAPAAESQPVGSMENTATPGAYQDGEYTVMGTYTSPGGPEEIEVTLVLENGVIVESEVVPQATLPISQQMQANFTSGYEELVIGKNIDEVELTKVAGSSLTPKGFNDAVEKIQQEALS